MTTRVLLRTAAALAVPLFFAACADLTYEAEEWRVAVVDSSTADVTVRYYGIGAETTNPDTRTNLAEELFELTAGTHVGSAFTPRLDATSRRLFMENGRLVLEESGTMGNPLSWLAQSGLNPVDWFNDPIALAESGTTIVKRDIPPDRQILATSGRVTDESTFQTFAVKGMPFEFGSDRNWQYDVDGPATDQLQQEDDLRLIVWPASARMFYWKLSGPAFGDATYSLAPEFSAIAAPRTTPR